MKLGKHWQTRDSIAATMMQSAHVSDARASEIRDAQLAGGLTPDATRTTQGFEGMTIMLPNDGSISTRVAPRLISPKRKVKLYDVGDEHKRRYGKSQLMREDGTPSARFIASVASRNIVTQPYGLHSVVTAEDLREADGGVDISRIYQRSLAAVIDLELEHQVVDFLTTSGNYATQHSAAVTNWDTASGDPIGDIITGKGVIMTDAGHSEMGGNFEWVLAVGWDTAAALLQNDDLVSRFAATSNDKGGAPDLAWVANALGVDRIEVSKMGSGPATQTTSAPVRTSNAFVWAATNDKASLLRVNKAINTTGRLDLGDYTAFMLVSRFERQTDTWFGGPELRSQSGDVQFEQVLDEWVIVPGAVDDTGTPTMIGAYLFTDTLA